MTPLQKGHHWHEPTVRSRPYHDSGPILPMESDRATINCGWGETVVLLLAVLVIVVAMLGMDK